MQDQLYSLILTPIAIIAYKPWDIVLDNNKHMHGCTYNMCIIAKILVESNFHRKPIINFHSIMFMRAGNHAHFTLYKISMAAEFSWIIPMKIGPPRIFLYTDIH